MTIILIQKKNTNTSDETTAFTLVSMPLPYREWHLNIFIIVTALQLSGDRTSYDRHSLQKLRIIPQDPDSCNVSWAPRHFMFRLTPFMAVSLSDVTLSVSFYAISHLH